MARPKGKIQARDASKYWLPPGVTFVNDLGDPNYRKETKVLFLDNVFGEFVSTFKALQDANASTHPEAIKRRRAQTNIEKYGVENAGGSPEARKKAQQTMVERYGVSHALQNKDILKKSQETLKQNYGVNTPMESDELKGRQVSAFVKKYGKTNPMKVGSIVQKLKDSNIAKYGVDNPSKTASIIEKILESNLKNQKTGSSKAELEINEFINNLGLTTKKGYIGGASPKELDIVVDEKKIAIEHNGCYYHSELFRPNNYHFEKLKSCTDKGMRLIQIFDYEWENRKQQVKSFLRSALGKNEVFIHGRKCEIKLVDRKEANDFLDRYHILGRANHKYAYGLYNSGELVSLITLGKHHRGLEELVLNRYVCKENTTINGGLSKLCKHAAKLHGTIYTWVDLRYSTGQNWVNSGWEVIHQLKPDYFYFDSKTSRVVSKQSRKKSLVGTPENVTEHEHALQDKLYRVYDCGKIKLKFSC